MTGEPHPALNGLVLSGGRSTRMGADKGALRYHGHSQREHLAGLLAPFCSEVFLSCEAAQAGGLPFIKDQFTDAGPLAGILSAFATTPDAAWLCVACDLPFLTAVTIGHLVAHRNPSGLATAFRNAAGDFPEPLVAIWEPAAYPVLLDYFEIGYKSPGRILLETGTGLLTAPDAAEFRNVNTEEEYRAALAELGRRVGEK